MAICEMTHKEKVGSREIFRFFLFMNMCLAWYLIHCWKKYSMEENKVGIRKLPFDYLKHGKYEQFYFDTIEQAKAFIDEDWEKENRNYNVVYLVAKPKDTWYYAIQPTAFDWNVWNNL